MEEGTIAKWHKKENEYVAAGDLLLEVATDKATVEHNALDEGSLRKILAPEGTSAKINEPLAIFTADKNESIEGFQKEAPKPRLLKSKKEKRRKQSCNLLSQLRSSSLLLFRNLL